MYGISALIVSRLLTGCGLGSGHIYGWCQNYGPFLGTLNIRCRIIIGTQKGTEILTTTHIPKPLIAKPGDGDLLEIRRS